MTDFNKLVNEIFDQKDSKKINESIDKFDKFIEENTGKYMICKYYIGSDMHYSLPTPLKKFDTESGTGIQLSFDYDTPLFKIASNVLPDFDREARTALFIIPRKTLLNVVEIFDTLEDAELFYTLNEGDIYG